MRKTVKQIVGAIGVWGVLGTFTAAEALDLYSNSQLRQYRRTFGQYSNVEVKRLGLRRNNKPHAEQKLTRLGASRKERIARIRKTTPPHSAKKLIEIGKVPPKRPPRIIRLP